MQKFGTSKGFVESATHILEGITSDLHKSLDLEAASKVASCDYEYNTAWGKQVWEIGLIFESKTTNWFLSYYIKIFQNNFLS